MNLVRDACWKSIASVQSWEERLMDALQGETGKILSAVTAGLVVVSQEAGHGNYIQITICRFMPRISMSNLNDTDVTPIARV